MSCFRIHKNIKIKHDVQYIEVYLIPSNADFNLKYHRKEINVKEGDEEGISEKHFLKTSK